MAHALRLQRKQLNTEGRNWRLGLVLPLLLSYFGIVGVTLGATGVLLPEMMSALQMSKDVFGRVMLAGPLVALTMLLMAGQLSVWLGKKRLALVGLLLMTGSRLALAAVRGVWSFTGALALTGASNAIMEITMNGAVLDSKRVTRRGIMNMLHAGLSASTMLGALGAGMLLALGWSYSWVLVLLVLPAALALVATLLVHYPGGEIRPVAAGGPGATLRLLLSRRGLTALALICLLNAICEGMIGLWSIFYLRELGAPVFLSGVAFALLSGATFIGRMANAPLVARRGPKASLMVSSVGVVVATALLLLPGSVPLAMLAFVLLGLAASGVIPTALSTAAHLVPGQSSAITGGVLAVTRVGFIIMPPLVGTLTVLFSLQAALVTVGLCGGLGMVALAWRGIE